MSYIYFDDEKEFKCPCGCDRKMRLSIQQSEGYGWNAFVMDADSVLASVGEDHIDERDG